MTSLKVKFEPDKQGLYISHGPGGTHSSYATVLWKLIYLRNSGMMFSMPLHISNPIVLALINYGMAENLTLLIVKKLPAKLRLV